MAKKFELKAHFKTSPKVIYEAWLNSEKHTQMTGGEAECSDKIGGRFTAWDEYIWGSNIVLEHGKKIVQHWRTAEFLKNDPDSELTIVFKEKSGGCQLTLTHKKIPESQTSDYKQGWIEHYFEPMKAFFEAQ